MLDIKTADIRQTRFYQEVFQEGREEGREEGAQQAEAGLLVRLLARNLGALSEEQEAQVRALSLEQLDALGDALFDVADHDALNAWLQAHPVEPLQLEEE
jgi:predicted transposase YdaD